MLDLSSVNQVEDVNLIQFTVFKILVSTKICMCIKIDCRRQWEEKDFCANQRKLSEKFKGTLKKLDVPCKVLFTLIKLKTCLPSLKPHVDTFLWSKVVYKIECPYYKSCYDGQTSRHLHGKIREHKRKSSLVGNHFTSCNKELSMENVKIVTSTFPSITFLMTLEVLHILKWHFTESWYKR